MDVTFSPLLGIAGAAVLGGAIGLQRQAAGKAAGFRTHLLVATGAAAFTAIGAHLHDTRIPSYIVVGIGFLGSGAIVRQGATTQGLTTAASIWMAAAVGLAMGYSSTFSLYVAVIATALTLCTLILSDAQLMRLFHLHRKATLRVTSTSASRTAAEVVDVFRRLQIGFEDTDILSIDTQGADEVAQLLYVVDLPPGRDAGALVRELSSLSGVRRVECNEAPS